MMTKKNIKPVWVKKPRENEPLWKEWDQLANKKGIRHTVYSVNGDEYTGEWLNNLKHGKGTYTWKSNGALFDGDWAEGKRCGFGTYSTPEGKGFRKVYSGGWKNNMRHGYGTNFYTDKDYYEGEWYADKRSGWGRMYYEDGSVYEGEWFDDERSGQGMMRMPSEDRYEGSWKHDKKNGPGKYFYLAKGQLYEGVWLDNVAKCGEMRDFGRETAEEATQFAIPEIGLLDSRSVLDEAEETFCPDQD